MNYLGPLDIPFQGSADRLRQTTFSLSAESFPEQLRNIDSHRHLNTDNHQDNLHHKDNRLFA